MLSSKSISRIAALMMALAVCVCLLAVVFYDTAAADDGISMEYETALFRGSEIISINILMDENEWQDLLNHAIEEEYHRCDVEVNGTLFQSVGIRTAGNSSLSFIVRDPDSDRYSLKLEFDRYVDGQTCFGLDKLVLHNNYCDASNMKEALVYDMYHFVDADASLCNYAKIDVNGEYWGLYLALEAVEDSFLMRNYGLNPGALYKPDNMDIGEMRRNFGNMNLQNMDFSKFRLENFGFGDTERLNALRESFSGVSFENFDFGNIDDLGALRDQFGDFGNIGALWGSSGGANLEYTDDNLDNYSTIWKSAVFQTGTADHRRVVRALKHISEGDLEDYLDIDNVLKYMAVHTFASNMDSLSGPWAHNYYLYERDGRLNLLPWDYNLSFGGGSTGLSASEVVNGPVDYSFHATTFFDGLFDQEKYREKYHAYLRVLCEEYVQGGGLDAFYDRTRSRIDALVETDPTGFYSGGEYREAAETFYSLVKLRGEGVLGQINGTIPSTEAGQRENASALMDVSDIDMRPLGDTGVLGGIVWESGQDQRSGMPDLEPVQQNALSFNLKGMMRTITIVGNAVKYTVCFAVMAAAIAFAARFKRKSCGP